MRSKRKGHKCDRVSAEKCDSLLESSSRVLPSSFYVRVLVSKLIFCFLNWLWIGGQKLLN